MQQLLVIAAGGSLGALARFGLSSFIQQSTNEVFPWGTLIVNLGGSFMVGLLVELFDVAVIPSAWRSFLTIGFLASFTTFSTLTLETVNLFRDGEVRIGALNLIMSNVGGVLFVAFGIYASRFFLKLFS